MPILSLYETAALSSRLDLRKHLEKSLSGEDLPDNWYGFFGTRNETTIDEAMIIVSNISSPLLRRQLHTLLSKRFLENNSNPSEHIKVICAALKKSIATTSTLLLPEPVTAETIKEMDLDELSQLGLFQSLKERIGEKPPHPELMEKIFYSAVEKGHLDIAKWVYNQIPDDKRLEVLTSQIYGKFFFRCVIKGHLDIFDWGYRQLIQLDPKEKEDFFTRGGYHFFNTACQWGKVELAEHLYKRLGITEQKQAIIREDYYAFRVTLLSCDMPTISWILTKMTSMEQKAAISFEAAKGYKGFIDLMRAEQPEAAQLLYSLMTPEQQDAAKTMVHGETGMSLQEIEGRLTTPAEKPGAGLN